MKKKQEQKIKNKDLVDAIKFPLIPKGSNQEVFTIEFD